MHVGLEPLPIGDFLNQLQSNPEILPPRTGHLGNWNSILDGQGKALDFNRMISENKWGYPLIYAFTRTESIGADAETGDTIYRPGHVLLNGKMEALELYTWNGQEFVLRDRRESYFCPFVLAKFEGELQPLSQIHLV